jgi:hypothetical protein
MKLFAPNVLVVGDTIFQDAGDPSGRPNPAPAAERYEAEIMALHDKITASQFGANWLDIVGNNVEPITIVPMVDTSDAVAQTFPNIPQKPNRLADSMPAGFPTGAAGAGTGRGTPVRLKFNPAGSAGSGLSRVGGAVLLVHEMTHAYRSASGRFTPLSMSGFIDPERLLHSSDLALRFPNWEEWFAIVCENVFAAETGGHILRANWDIQHPASLSDPGINKYFGTGPLHDSEDFAADYRPAIAHMRQVEQKIYMAIRGSTAWFNPVRDYEELLFAQPV